MSKRLKLSALAGAIMVAFLPMTSHAESWFQFEAGLGAQHSKDDGDGIWIQQGVASNRENTSGSVFTAGFTGELYANGRFGLRYHADYFYFGGLSASVDGVPDANYNSTTHQVVGVPATTGHFNGGGHTQGLALTLEPSWLIGNGWRVTAEGGPMLYWASWHESLVDDTIHKQYTFNHVPKMQLGWVAGVGIEKGNFSIKYRWMKEGIDWGKNGTPGLVTGTQMVTAMWRF